METLPKELLNNGIKKIEIPKHQPLSNKQKWEGIKERYISGNLDRQDPIIVQPLDAIKYIDKMIEKCIQHQEV